MQHIGRPAAVEFTGGQVGRDPAEQGKALQIVQPLAAVRGQVGIAGPLVQVGRVDHVGRHAVVGQPAQAQGDAAGAENRPQLAHHGLAFDALQNGRQAGQHQPHIGAGGSQGLGQRADHIGQPPCFNERKHLGGGMQDFHSAAIFASMFRVTKVMPFGLR